MTVSLIPPTELAKLTARIHELETENERLHSVFDPYLREFPRVQNLRVKAEADKQRVRDLHQPYEASNAWKTMLACKECTDSIEDNLVEYPCPTIEALGDTK